MINPLDKNLKAIAVSYGVMATLCVVLVVLLFGSADFRFDKYVIDLLGGALLRLLVAFLISGSLAAGAWIFRSLSGRWRLVVLSIAIVAAGFFATNVAIALWLVSQGRHLVRYDLPMPVQVSAIASNSLLAIGLVLNAFGLLRAYARLQVERH